MVFGETIFPHVRSMVVQGHLGPSSVAITLDACSHFLPPMVL